MRVNLLHAHGSPTMYLHTRGCRCLMCRSANAEYHRRYREAHPEKIAGICQRYREKNREAITERGRRYYETHLEEMTAYSRDYRAANAEKISEYRRRFHDAHPERRAEYGRRYYESHRDVYRAQDRTRRARELGAPGTHTATDVAAQYECQRGRCFWCRAKVAWPKKHVDHVTPLAKGGSDGPENIVIACPHCNHTKSAIHPMDFAGVML